MGRFNLAAHIQAAQLPAPRDIETITVEILDAKRAGGEAILTIGRGLIEAKALLSHGEWLPWLEERVDISEKVAQNFMRLARHYSNPKTLSDLGASKALILLALPEDIRDEYIETPHVVGGEEKTVVDMSTRELKTAIKERDEALKAAAQAQAEQSAAEQAREKLSADMALANERIAVLNAEVEAQTAAAARLEKELEDLRSRPVDVAIQADEAAVEAARKEAEDRMQAQLNQARKAREKAFNACRAAEAAKAEAQKELEQVRAERKAALSSSEDLVLFRMLLDQAQEAANKLGGVLMKVYPKDPRQAQEMSEDLLALGDKIREAAIHWKSS